MPKNKKIFIIKQNHINSIKKTSKLKVHRDVENLWINYKYGKRYLVKN